MYTPVTHDINWALHYICDLSA